MSCSSSSRKFREISSIYGEDKVSKFRRNVLFFFFFFSHEHENLLHTQENGHNIVATPGCRTPEEGGVLDHYWDEADTLGEIHSPTSRAALPSSLATSTGSSGSGKDALTGQCRQSLAL